MSEDVPRTGLAAVVARIAGPEPSDETSSR